MRLEGFSQIRIPRRALVVSQSDAVSWIEHAALRTRRNVDPIRHLLLRNTSTRPPSSPLCFDSILFILSRQLTHCYYIS